MQTKTAPRTHGSETFTNGIRVQVSPTFLTAQSDPSAGKYLFAYNIVITNERDETLTLRRRHWVIVDADGERHDVRGQGVVGQQPVLASGQRFEYASFCPLPTAWGTMEGTYEFEREDGSSFTADISRFYLVSSRSTSAKPVTAVD
ncbi:MAG: Co2+/Mg2+ efflux protein ApaG [Phycisphaerae bacterium]|nr:Co2+/Mg2+ efflux protein ApaG [Phycisphaerae bacterium]